MTTYPAHREPDPVLPENPGVRPVRCRCGAYTFYASLFVCYAPDNRPIRDCPCCGRLLATQVDRRRP
jgi:hypothetical protein